MAGNAHALQAKRSGERVNILRHRFLVVALWRLVVAIGRLGRLAEAAQIRRDHRIGLGKLGNQRPPHVAVLRITVQQNDRFAFAGGEIVQPHAAKLGKAALDFDCRLRLRLGHGAAYLPDFASECTQPCMRFLALAMSSFENQSSGFTFRSDRPVAESRFRSRTAPWHRYPCRLRNGYSTRSIADRPRSCAPTA